MNAEEYAKWELSPEGVHYRLGAGMTLMGVDAADMDRLITLTVAALPAEVRQFVYDACNFATVGSADNHGQVLPPNNSWLILLDSDMPERLGDDSTRSVIAHEIAHAWLGHRQDDWTIYNRGDEIEQAARKLALAWGFAGAGTETLR